MTVQEIVTRVRSAIDELPENGSALNGLTDDEENMTRIIADKIGYGVVHILEHAPLDKMDAATFSALSQDEIGTLFSIDNEVGKLKLPENVLRIVDARLSSWPYFPTPELDNSQVALMQSDKYARGSYDRPVNIFTYNGKDRYLYMYSAKELTDTVTFTYVAKPSTAQYSASNLSQTVDIPSKLEAALIYQVAGLTMTAYREDIAASLFAIAKDYMGIVEE